MRQIARQRRFSGASGPFHAERKPNSLALRIPAGCAGEPGPIRRPRDADDRDGPSISKEANKMYEDVEEKRSRLLPILMTVTAVLALVLAAVVVLYLMGIFEPKTPTPAAVAAPAAAAPTPVAATPSGEGEAQPLNPPAGEPASQVQKAVVSVAPPAQGEPPVKATHGDWQTRCDKPAGAQNEQCVLMQFVTAEDRDNVGLTVIVLKTADRKAKIMRVLAPLGVLLPSGLGLKIDETDMGRAGFVRCLPNGCVAEVILEDKLLKSLEGGKTATFIIFQTPEEGIGIPISLAGFQPGFDSLP
jgi:invasion protein IalB